MIGNSGRGRSGKVVGGSWRAGDGDGRVVLSGVRRRVAESALSGRVSATGSAVTERVRCPGLQGRRGAVARLGLGVGFRRGRGCAGWPSGSGRASGSGSCFTSPDDAGCAAARLPAAAESTSTATTAPGRSSSSGRAPAPASCPCPTTSPTLSGPAALGGRSPVDAAATSPPTTSVRSPHASCPRAGRCTRCGTGSRPGPTRRRGTSTLSRRSSGTLPLPQPSTTSQVPDDAMRRAMLAAA